MARVSLGTDNSIGESFEVDLWGAVFTTTPATRSVQKQADDLSAKLVEAKDADEYVTAMAALISLRLKPADGKRKTAEAIIVEKWEADDLEVPQLDAFVEQLGVADTRPT